MMNVDPSSAGAPAAALIVCALFLWPFGVRAPAAETPAVAPTVHASGGIPPLWQTLPPTPALPEGTHGHTVAVDGARLWYATWGTPSKRTPVVLLHGGKGNSNYFGDLIPILTAHGYRVIAMDSRGHGRSTRTDEPMTYHLMAEDVVHLLDALHLPRVSLVGWSDGGIIGIDMGLNHPDRVARLFAFGANVNLAGERDDVLACTMHEGTDFHDHARKFGDVRA
jgi:poly(3-hydroxybutyrate) depolymerase